MQSANPIFCWVRGRSTARTQCLGRPLTQHHVGADANMALSRKGRGRSQRRSVPRRAIATQSRAARVLPHRLDQVDPQPLLHGVEQIEELDGSQ